MHGWSLGGAIAVLAIKRLHEDSNYKDVFLIADRTFRSIAHVIPGHIANVLMVATKSKTISKSGYYSYLPAFKVMEIFMNGWNYDFAAMYDQIDPEKKMCLHVTEDFFVPYHSSLQNHSEHSDDKHVYEGGHVSHLNELTHQPKNYHGLRELAVFGSCAATFSLPFTVLPAITIIPFILGSTAACITGNLVYNAVTSALDTCIQQQQKSTSFLELVQNRISQNDLAVGN